MKRGRAVKLPRDITTVYSNHRPRLCRQTSGGTQTYAAGAVCRKSVVSNQAPVGLAGEDGAGQLPPCSVLLAG